MISGTIRVIVFPIMQIFRNFTISMLHDGQQDNQPVYNLHNSNKLTRTRRKVFYFIVAYN